MADEIEKLTVAIEAEIGKFAKDIKDSVSDAEGEFKKLDKTVKKVFDSAGNEIEDFNKKVRGVKFSAKEIERALDLASRSGKVSIKQLTQEQLELNKAIDLLKKTGRFEIGDFEKPASSADRFMGALRGVGVALGVVTAAFAAMGAAAAVAFQRAQEGLASIRIQRSFFNLAASVGQSGEEILEAMREATAGTINDMELMRLANQQLQLGIAKTPEEMAKVTRAAILLGRTTGRDATDSINRLVAAAGRGSTEVLDELGITLIEVNNEMERLAQQQFGEATGGLSAAQNQAVRLQATINLAVQKADDLGTEIDDVGTSIERTQAKWANLNDDFNKANLLFTDVMLRAVAALYDRLFGAAGLFPLSIQAGNIFAETVATGLSTVAAIANVAVLGLNDVVQLGIAGKNLLKGEGTLAEFNEQLQDVINPAEIARNIANRYQSGLFEAYDNVKEHYAEIFGGGIDTGIDPLPNLPEDIEDAGEKAKDLLSKLSSDLLDLQEKTNEALEENEQEHSERMADIAQDAADKRAEAAEKYRDAINDLEEDTAQRREEIFADAREDLRRLERDTNEDLADERREFETEERRETEDHLTDLRRLREQYLFDLEDAVKERDARAIVDLQRRFRMEQNNRVEDFETQQSRRREDQDERLREIRENERRRSEEILASRERELQQLAENEQRKRDQLSESYDQQIERINEAEAEKLAIEQEKYEERKAELENAISERLEQIAKSLADEEGITEEGAKGVLGALAKYFGKGGEIDKLMDDFRNRLDAKIDIEVEFSSSGSAGGRSGARSSARRAGRSAGGRPRASFAQGGTMFASSPTLVEFGEAGPEMATFTPLGQMQQSATMTRRSEIDMNLKLSGSAPPGIRSADRDAIAGVLVNALRDAGVMSRGR